MYAKLSDSYQWNQMNSGGILTNKVQELLSKGEQVSLNRIPSAILKIKNRIKSPITTQMLDAIQDGSMVLIYAPEIKVPLYLPFIISQTKPNSCTGIIFLNNLDATGDEKEIFLNERKLKVVMEACYISMMIANLGNSPKIRSTTLIRSGSKIYSGIITECINRKHSIKLDPNLYNSIMYLASRYYVGTILGCRTSMDAEMLQNYCLYNCKQADWLSMKKIIDQYEEVDFDNIANFINKTKSVEEFNKRLGNLTVSNFLESYINMYDSSMLLALENFNYFFYNVLSVNESTYVNNYQVLKNLVGDDGKKMYADLVVSVCER